MLQKFQTNELQNPVLFSNAYQVLYCLIMTIISFQVKLLSNLPIAQILVFRSAFQLVITMVVQNLTEDKSSYCIKDKTLSMKMYIRVFIGGAYALIFYYGITLISLSNASILTSTAPLWTAIIMIYILKKQERSYTLLVQIFFCILGVIFVVQPPFFTSFFKSQVVQTPQGINYSQQLLGFILMILCAIGFSIISIIMKQIGSKISPLVVINYQSIATIVIGALILIQTGCSSMPTIQEIQMIILMASLGFVSQIFLIQSFAIGKVTQLSLVGNSQVIFGLLFDLIILDYQVNVSNIIGIVLIMGSLIINLLIN